ADRGEWVGGAGNGAGAVGAAGDGQPAVDVPAGQRPPLAAAEGDQLEQCVVGLGRADPEAGGAGADGLRQPLGERQEGPLWVSGVMGRGMRGVAVRAVSYTNPLMLSDLSEAVRRKTGRFAASKPERISGFVNQVDCFNGCSARWPW